MSEPDYLSPEDVRFFSNRVGINVCERGSAARVAVEGAIAQLARLLPWQRTSPTRREARAHFAKIARLEQRFGDPKQAPLLAAYESFLSKAYRPGAIRGKRVPKKSRQLFDRVSSIIPKGKGRADFYSTLGLPAPTIFTAYFVVELFVFCGRRAPDKKSRKPQDACGAIWQGAHRAIGQEETTPELEWTRHLGDARSYRDIILRARHDLRPLRSRLGCMSSRLASVHYDAQFWPLVERHFAAVAARKHLPGTAENLRAADLLVTRILQAARSSTERPDPADDSRG